MRKLIRSAALVAALAAGAAFVPAQAQWMGYGNGFWGDNEVGLWESDNWATDDYGMFDQDFAWNTNDAGFNDWYGDSQTAWNEYDDIGDEGWFDV